MLEKKGNICFLYKVEPKNIKKETSHATNSNLFLNFFYLLVLQNNWRIMDTIASILRKKYALIFVHGYYMILEAVRILEQVMSADKYLSYFRAK